MNSQYKVGSRVYCGASWCRSFGTIISFYENFEACVKSSTMSTESFMEKQFFPIYDTSLPWIKIHTRKGNVVYSQLHINENMNEWKLEV